MVEKKLVDVLIVDDREDGLIALEAVLFDLKNVRVVRARSGNEAISLLPLYDFGVILLDVQMPILDGFETAEIIRQTPKYKLTPIIFVTAINKDDQYIYRGYAAGAVDYIFKPFEPQILRSKVSIFIELFLKSRQLEAQSEIIRESERRERYLRLAELEVESLKRYRSLADAIPHIVWKSKVDGTLDYFNKVWTDFTGLTQEQSVGSGWQDSIEPDDLKDFLKAWIQAMLSKQSFQIETRIRRHDGEYRWHWMRVVPEIRHEDIVAWLGTCTDIHDRKLSEVSLIEAQRAAVTANKAKTNFLANMSHEIRTPMGAILGFTELMQNPLQSEEDRNHCITTIRRSGQQLLTIIDEILDISKVESGRLEIEKIDIKLASLLSDLHSLLNIQTERKGLNLNFEISGAVPEHICSDPTRIRQILMNVIGNAIKFTTKGAITLRVSWIDQDASNAGTLKFEVIDTGVGIANDQVQRLFQPFMQVDSSTTRKFGGTGLGLALSRKLAQALGGDVRLEATEPGAGSTFVVEVGTTHPASTAWTSQFNYQSASTSNYSEVSPDYLKNINILLVDDAPENQTVISLFLNSAGANVDFADNGEEGVRKALAGKYDIVLMDIQMPLLDGYQATARLREHGYSIPIIALTAHALKEERDRCLRVGCTDHFTKPIDRLKLISLVGKIVLGNSTSVQSAISALPSHSFSNPIDN